MAESAVDPTRSDPYKAFRFRLKWDGRYVAGVSKVSALSRSTAVVTHREGGEPSSPRQSPGRTSYEPIVIERGVIHDTEFERWVNGAGDGAPAALGDLRKDIVIEMHDAAGQLVTAYRVFRCWVSEYHALPELDASADVVAIQTMKLENEGWERDTAVVGPERTEIRPTSLNDSLIIV